MVNCVITLAGEKIKNLREKYKVKQEDIAGSDITRNLISEIEHNKVKVSRNTAEVILKHLNKLAAERGFNIEETVDYLVEDELSQASNILDEFIEELKTLSVYKDDSFINTLNEAESFLINWDIKDKKIAIYELAGDYFCTKNDLYKSVVYYEKVLALIGKVSLSKPLLNILRKLSMVYEYIGNYKKSIECCEFALNYFTDMPNEYAVIFRYNASLAYKDMNNLEFALYNIDIAETLVDKNDTGKLFNIMTNKANYLYKLKDYEKSINLNDKILNLIDKNDIEKQLLTHINIISNYIALELKDKVINDLDYLIKNLCGISHDSLYIADIYFEIGKIYAYINNENKSEKFYLKALEFSGKRNDYVLESKILDNLIDFYTSCNNVEMMEDIKSNVFTLSNKQGFLNGNLIYKLFYFYSNNDRTIKELSMFALKFN